MEVSLPEGVTLKSLRKTAATATLAATGTEGVRQVLHHGPTTGARVPAAAMPPC